MNKYKKSIGELAKENPTKTYKELEQMREEEQLKEVEKKERNLRKE